MAGTPPREEWKSVSTDDGAPSVTTDLETSMLVSSAVNWDSQQVWLNFFQVRSCLGLVAR